MTDEGVPELTTAAVIAAGGWHPRHAVVVDLRQIGNRAVAVVTFDGTVRRHTPECRAR